MAAYDDVIRVDQRGTYVACCCFRPPHGHPPPRRHHQYRLGGRHAFDAARMRMRPAKAAVISTTECLAAEWGPAQVRVNAVSPGYTRTPALQAAIDRGERDPSALAGNSALARLVEPSEIAKVVVFLASPLASAITGANVPVDCGWLVAPSWHTYGGLREPGNVKGDLRHKNRRGEARIAKTKEGCHDDVLR